MKRILLSALALVALSTTAQAQIYQDGVHYETLDQATANTGEVVVTEAFSYLCNHCKTFEPFIQSWISDMPEGVRFERIPVVFGRDTWGLYARGYVAAATMGVADEAHTALMDQIWVEQKPARSLEELAQFYSQFGIDPESYLATAESFAVDMRIRKEQQQVRDFGVTGTPTMIVNGKYRISAGGAVGSFDQMLKIVDYLVGVELAQQTAQAETAEPVADEVAVAEAE